MTPEDQEYYESLFEMYSSDGWKNLMADLEEHKKHYMDIRNVSPNCPLDFQRGRLDEIEFLLNHEETMKQAYEEMKDANL